jgi:hypothetical protein
MSCNLANRKQAWNFVQLNDKTIIEQIRNDLIQFGTFIAGTLRILEDLVVCRGLVEPREGDWLARRSAGRAGAPQAIRAAIAQMTNVLMSIFGSVSV